MSILREQIKSCVDPEELDEIIQDLKGEEAAEINNGGIDAQLDYVEKNAGLRWLARYLGLDGRAPGDING